MLLRLPASIAHASRTLAVRRLSAKYLENGGRAQVEATSAWRKGDSSYTRKMLARGLSNWLAWGIVATVLLLAWPAQAQTWELLSRTVADRYSAGFNGSALAPNGEVVLLGGVSGTAQLGNLGAVGMAGSYTNALIAKYSPQSTQWQWSNYLFTPPGGTTATRALVLPGGDVLVLGTFRGGYGGTAFGTLPPLFAVGIYDGYVARLDGATGRGRWVAPLASRYAFDLVQPQAMVLGANGELLVTGSFRNELQLGTLPPLVSARPGQLGSGDMDLFVARLDIASGHWLQGFRAGGLGDDFATDLVALPGGDVALAGMGRAPLTLGSLAPLTGPVGPRAFVARLDPVGQQWRWAAVAAGQRDSLLQAQRLTMLPGGDVVVSGKYAGTLQLSSGLSLGRGLGRVSTLVGRVRASDGLWQWAVSGAGTGRPMGSGGLGTTPAGEVFITNSFSGGGRFGQLPEVHSLSVGPDIYVAQLAGADGRWQWLSTAGGYGGPGGTGYTFSDDDMAGDLQVLDNQHLLVSGSFCQGAYLSPTIGPLRTTFYDGFLARITVPAPCPDTLTAAAGLRIIADSASCQTGWRTLRVVGAAAGSAFRWSTGASGPALPIVTAGRYEVQVRTPAGCSYRVSYTVSKLLPTAWDKIPNVITPNGDGLNDRWVVPGLPTGTRLQLYSRWGRLVYQTRAYANDWEATGLSGGLYYYVLEQEQLCPSPRVTGWVEVIR